jgi:DTW domain-containing protein YfiP
MQNIQVNKRIICNSCGYAKSTCVCQWVKPIQSPLGIVILQHPKETKHAKNTVKLLQLSLSNIEVIQGESAQDFQELAETVTTQPDTYSLCYPNQNSKPIESTISQSDKPAIFSKSHKIILIDASWRKAFKMWHLNPWLHKLDSWHFDAPPTNQYAIRHTTQANSLSTLESAAYLLNLTHNVDCSSLLTLFANMQQKCFLNNSSTRVG